MVPIDTSMFCSFVSQVIMIASRLNVTAQAGWVDVSTEKNTLENMVSQKETSIPTIHFHVAMLVSGGVTSYSWLGYIEDYDTQLNGDYFINHGNNESLWSNQDSKMESKSCFFLGSCFFVGYHPGNSHIAFGTGQFGPTWSFREGSWWCWCWYPPGNFAVTFGECITIWKAMILVPLKSQPYM